MIAREGMVRDRLPADPVCGQLALLDLELFVGASPELERFCDDLRRRTEAGPRVIVLRLKRTRNPDLVCMARLEHFPHDMQARSVMVLLSGVRPDCVRAMANLRFGTWFPSDQVFAQGMGGESSTLAAVRHAYKLIGDRAYTTCPRRSENGTDQGVLSYMI